MDIILIGLFIIALGCVVFVNGTSLIDKLNEEDDASFDIMSTDYQFDITNIFFLEDDDD